MRLLNEKKTAALQNVVIIYTICRKEAHLRGHLVNIIPIFHSFRLYLKTADSKLKTV